MGTYSRGTYVTLPTDDGDLTTVMSAGEVSDVATINNVFVVQNLSNQIAAEMFKNTCSASLANLLWVGQSDLAPSISPITLEAYNYSTAAWVGQATNAAAATNATCTLVVTLGTTQYISPGGYTTGRVYQAAAAAGLVRTDNFNRANANPIGGNWSTLKDQSACQIILTSYAYGNGGVSMSYWNADSFAANQYAKVKLIAVGNDGGPALRMDSSGSTSKGIFIDATAATDNIEVYQNTGASWAQVGSSISTTVNDGDIIKGTISGQTLNVFVNDIQVGGDFTIDASISSGNPGIYCGAAGVDDWEGGNL